VATFVTAAYPLFAILFFVYLPVRYAIAATVIVGYVFLPPAFTINFQGLPDLDKAFVPPLAALVLAAVFVKRQRSAPAGPAGRVSDPPLSPLPGWIPSSALMRLCMLIVLLIPIATYATNTQAVVRADQVSIALRPYDILSILNASMNAFLALLLGRKYLYDAAGHRAVLYMLGITALLLSPLVLYEIRMSPQLNNIVYGYFPHDWRQHIRGGGFRPVVFFEHGLRLAIFNCMGAIAIIAYFRASTGERKLLYFFASLYLVFVLMLSNSFGAAIIALMLVPLAYVLSRRMLILVASVCAVLVLAYPIAAAFGFDPFRALVPIIERIDPSRAGSFVFRLEQGDLYLAHVQDRPFFGWGPYNRWVPTGGAVPDAYWMIVIATQGWVGYFGVMGMIFFPVILLLVSSRKHPPSIALAGLALVLGANYLDLLPNSSSTPITMIISGAIIGHLDRLRLRLPDATAEAIDSAEALREAAARTPGQQRAGSSPPTPVAVAGDAAAEPQARQPGSRYTRYPTLPHRRRT